MQSCFCSFLLIILQNSNTSVFSVLPQLLRPAGNSGKLFCAVYINLLPSIAKLGVMTVFSLPFYPIVLQALMSINFMLFTL
jgi:hypothetical protein